MIFRSTVARAINPDRHARREVPGRGGAAPETAGEKTIVGSKSWLSHSFAFLQSYLPPLSLHLALFRRFPQSLGGHHYGPQLLLSSLAHLTNCNRSMCHSPSPTQAYCSTRLISNSHVG